MIQLRWVEYVLAIAKYRTMRAAARNLFVSEPTMSQQIREFEKALGIQLFDRTGSCLWLTDDCRMLLPTFQRMVDARDHVLSEAYSLRARRDRIEREA